jgi:hypothetical protein
MQDKEMEQYKILDNYVVDAETGEILGEVMDASGGISNLDSLQAILEKRLRLIKQVQAEEQILSFMIENQKKILKRKSSYLNYFEALWLPLVEQFVKQRLAGAKTKSIDTLYGRISMRTVKGGLKVEDPTLALAEAHRLGYLEAIKVTESFQISKLTAEQKEVLATSEGFTLSPDREVMSISEPTQEAK